MAIYNHLLLEFAHDKIDQKYDFFMVTTTEKYIPFGAKCLDKSSDAFQVESIAFENGKSLFIMSKAKKISRYEIVKELQSDTLSVKKALSRDIPVYILFRLFLYSLNNYEHEELSFNNLTGKFYIFSPEWMKKNKSSFVALGIDLDADNNLTIEAATFAKYILFKPTPKLNEYPKYAFSNKNNSLRRVFDSQDLANVYIKKGIFNKKAEMSFLSLDKKDIELCKCYFLYRVLGLLETKYKDLLDVTLDNIPITKTIGAAKATDFMDKAVIEFKRRNTNFVNCVKGGEFASDFEALIESIIKKYDLTYSADTKIDKASNNIVFIHNKAYYESHEYPDPYQSFLRDSVIQCLTEEDSAERIIKDNDAIISTIIKECAIKSDILRNKRITIDDWASFDYKKDWVFGKEKNGHLFFMIVHPDGSFEFYNKPDDLCGFDIEVLDQCAEYLVRQKGKEKTIIASANGDINVISRTNLFPLPTKALFQEEKISRSKESRESFLAGVVDINWYSLNQQNYYSVGIKGSGMNTKIIRAPHLYRVDVLSGENIVGQLLETLSVLFVKYKSFTVLPYPIKYLNEYIEMIEDRERGLIS